MAQINAPAVVAVTGANGFIGSFIVQELLHRGYTVRAVVRDPTNETKTAHLKKLTGDKECKGRLELFAGDLLTPGSYDDAFKGAEAVIHTAAVVAVSGDPSKIIKPSLDGTRNVLDAITASGSVKRIVHTSSMLAVTGVFSKPQDYVYTEKDKSTESSVATGDAYGYAKLGAEEMVWEYVGKNPNVTAVVLNPGLVLGPSMTKAHTKATPSTVREFLYGNEQPNHFATPVDVRDVAYAHVQGLVEPKAVGQRFLIANDKESMWLHEHAKRCKEAVPEFKVHTDKFYPMWKVWLSTAWPAFLLMVLAVAIFAFDLADSFSPMVAGGVGVFAALLLFPLGPSVFNKNMLTRRLHLDTSRSRDILGARYMDHDKCLRDTALSLSEYIKVKARK